MFFALLPLPCLRGLKSLMSMTTAALHRLPAMTNLLLVGKWFWSDREGAKNTHFCRFPQDLPKLVKLRVPWERQFRGKLTSASGVERICVGHTPQQKEGGKGRQIEFFGNIPPKCFLRFAVYMSGWLPKWGWGARLSWARLFESVVCGGD